MIEVKNALRTHTLNGADLRKLFDQATQQGKNAVYLLYFEAAGVTAEIRLSNEPPDGWM